MAREVVREARTRWMLGNEQEAVNWGAHALLWLGYANVKPDIEDDREAVSEYFYNFTIAGENRGYSYLFLDSERLHSFTRFAVEGDEIFTNVFALRLVEGEVLACKHGDLDWVDLSRCPPDHFPGCAYPLLLPRAMDAPFSYVQISDDDGSVIGATELKRERADIVEARDGVVRRTFTMDGATPIRIDWGGAVSHLCADGVESAMGSGIAFSTE